jgi:hypothetical protein
VVRQVDLTGMREYSVGGAMSTLPIYPVRGKGYPRIVALDTSLRFANRNLNHHFVSPCLPGTRNVKIGICERLLHVTGCASALGALTKTE